MEKLQTRKVWRAKEQIKYHSVLDYMLTLALPGAILVDMCPYQAMEAHRAGVVEQTWICDNEYQKLVKRAKAASLASRTNLEGRLAQSRMRKRGMYIA